MKLSQDGLNEAFLKQKQVIVYLHGERIGEGIIEKHTKGSIVINGDHYLKHICDFHIK